MNKRDAKKAADEWTGTYGEALAIISSDMRPDEAVSTLNPSLTHGRVKGILRAALEQHNPAEKIVIWRPDPYRPGRQERSRDALIVQNVFRECA